MRIPRPLLPLALLAGLSACANRAQTEAPALVVIISVDQLRADLLDRYDPFFTGGFRRLRDQGAVFPGAHEHAGTETAAGHATLSTGVFPSRSGIVANSWDELVGGEWVEVSNVGDSLTSIVGSPGAEGRSPANLLRTGFADWLLAERPGSRVVSIGGKDRSAILLAGKAKGEVFWFDHDSGRFLTSSYYASAYPEWVRRFNAERVPTYFDSVWTNQAPAGARALARPDTAANEADGVHTFFPHRYSVEGEGETLIQWAEYTPFSDRVVLGLAEEAIRSTGLGKGDVPHFLGLGLSRTDAMGHRFGALSQEQVDNLFRLDRALGEFFDLLDREVGEGRWLVALSADHGALPEPEWQVAHGEPGYRLSAADRRRMRELATRAAEGGPKEGEPERVAAALRTLPFVADALTFRQIREGVPGDSFARLARNSFYPGRVRDSYGAYGVEVRYTPGTYTGGETGYGHGSPYYYDRSVPIVFLGTGVQPLRATSVARTVDVAPTLARLSGIRAPADLDGVSLLP